MIKCKKKGTVIAQLPLPSDQYGNYSKLEVIELALLHGKAAVIKAINEAKCYQKTAALHKFFPRESERYDDRIVRTLTAGYTVGSAEWQERAGQSRGVGSL